MTEFFNRCVETAKKHYIEDKELDGLVIIRAEGDNPENDVTWITPMPRDFRRKLVLLKILGISMALRESKRYCVMTLGWQAAYELPEGVKPEDFERPVNEEPVHRKEVLIIGAIETQSKEKDIAVFLVNRDGDNNIVNFEKHEISDKIDDFKGTMVTGFDIPNIEELPTEVCSAAEHVASHLIFEGKPLEEWANAKTDNFMSRTDIPEPPPTIH
jgi:hypothetical protein